MKLSENQLVVDALKCILRNDYPNLLEYDEVHSSGKNSLIVKKVGKDRDVDSSVFLNIIQKLEKATGKRFDTPGSITDGQSNSDKDWHHFYIREKAKPTDN